MTIAISTRIRAGIVLGTDTATTFLGSDGGAVKVYYNTHKVFQLHDNLPIGAITWGLGSVNQVSIESMTKELRRRFSDEDSSYYVNPANYQMKGVAALARQFLSTAARGASPTLRIGRGTRTRRALAELGLLVAGYSSGAELPEEWQILMDVSGAGPAPKLVHSAGEYGIVVRGQAEAVNLILNAYSEDYFEPIAKSVGVNNDEVRAMLKLYDRIKISRHPAQPDMPIRDAIELVGYLISTEMNYRRFMPYEAAATVGGHVEVAAITRFEGFRRVHVRDDFLPPPTVSQ